MACCRWRKSAPAYAVVDMRLGDGNGLDVISALKRRRPDARGIILTGYGNIATAVNAVKLGAVDYLAKPVDADDVVAALLALDNAQDRTAGKSDVGRPRALGAHPAHLRILRPQRFRNRTPAQHAPPHPAAYSGETRAAVAITPRPSKARSDRRAIADAARRRERTAASSPFVSPPAVCARALRT